MKRQTVDIKFTHRLKISIFTHRGDSLHHGVAWPSGTWVHLALRNFTSIGASDCHFRGTKIVSSFLSPGGATTSAGKLLKKIKNRRLT